MADFVDAANGLADSIVTALALGANGAAALIGGAIVKAYVGWPDKQTLDDDLAAGTVHISVWPLPMERITSITQVDADWTDDSAILASRETRRQSKRYQVSIWANAPATRDTLGRAIDAALSDEFRLTLADGTQGILTYLDGRLIDSRQTVNLYRRDSTYSINFGTLQTMAATSITAIVTTLESDVNGAAISTNSITTT